MSTWVYQSKKGHLSFKLATCSKAHQKFLGWNEAFDHLFLEVSCNCLLYFVICPTWYVSVTNSYQMDLQLVKWNGRKNSVVPGTCVYLMSIWKRKHLCRVVSNLMRKLWKWYSKAVIEQNRDTSHLKYLS